MALSSPQIQRPGLLGLLAASLTVTALAACLGLIGLASALEARSVEKLRMAAPRVMSVQKEADTTRSPLKAHGG